MNPLLRARLALGFTQQEVATRTGTSQQYVQRLESGQASSCPPLIATFYSTFTDDDLTREYAGWVKDERQKLPDVSQFFKSVETISAKAGRYYATGETMFTTLCNLLGIEKSERELAETLHLHPVIVNRWRNKGGQPITLVKALKDTAQ